MSNISPERKIAAMNAIPINQIHNFFLWENGLFEVFSLTETNSPSLANLIKALVLLQEYYNKAAGSRENSIVLTKLDEAWLYALESDIVPETPGYKDALSMAIPKVQQINRHLCFDGNKFTVQIQIGHPEEQGSIYGCFNTHWLDALTHFCEVLIDLAGYKEEKKLLIKCYDRLFEAGLWLNKRHIDRRDRGVLNTDKP